MRNMDIYSLLLKPSNKSMNKHGEKLPNGLLSLWTSLGIGYQTLFPLNDLDSVNKYIFWWLHFGQKEYVGLKKELNFSLCLLLHNKIIDEKYQISNLMKLIYENSPNLNTSYPNLQDQQNQNAYLEWWYTYGYKEYFIPFFGISIDKIKLLKFAGDLLCDFGYGHNFTKVLRHLYSHIGIWKQEFDISTTAGSANLIKNFITNILQPEDDISIILNISTIDFLSSITNDFTNFETQEFIIFCNKLWFYCNAKNSP